MKKVLVQITLNPVDVSDDTELLEMLTKVQDSPAHFVRREATADNVSVRIKFVDEPQTVKRVVGRKLVEEPIHLPND